MKLLLILSLFFYLEASIISDNEFTKRIANLRLEEDNEKQLIQTVTVSKEIINCLKNTKIMPKSIINSFASRKTIIVTKDYEYIVDKTYNSSIRNQINNSTKFCINREKRNEIGSGGSAGKEFRCNMTKLEESISTNYPKKYQAHGISLTPSRSGEMTEVENYDSLISYVNNLLSKSEETHDYKIYDILFDTNCQKKFGILLTKKEYEERKNNNTFFDE